MNHDLIGFLIIAVGLTLVCAPFMWAERRQERAQRDALLLAALDRQTQDLAQIAWVIHCNQALALANLRQSALADRLAIRDHAELVALTTTADLPDDMRSIR